MKELGLRQNHQQWLFRRQLSLASLTKLLLDPVVSIAALVGVVLLNGENFGREYQLLSLIVFSLTFPGTWPEPTFRAFFSDISLPWFSVAGILLLFGYVGGYEDTFPVEVVVQWVLAVPVMLFIAHRFASRLLPRLIVLEGGERTAVVVGAGKLGRQLAEAFDSDRYSGIKFVGYFDDRIQSDRLVVSKDSVLGTLETIPEYVKNNNVDLVYIALPVSSQPRIVKMLNELRDTTASIYFVPDFFVSDLIQARIDHIRGIPVLAICETPLYGINRVGKRFFDLVFSSLMLVLLAPLMAAIALGVKLSSPGPILFKQRRYGQDGEEIMVYKFRSMSVCEDSHEEIKQATKGDMRVTRFGAFLRKSSLDELPQFINVLQGQMSVVGPRPHAVAHNELYRKLINGYMLRHKVKPGITGWAQVNGLRGETETVEKMRARIQYDLDYLRQWTLLFDLVIILKTFLVVLRNRNAY
ncbi:capsular polysaccharide biosynthesis protein [Sulfuriferula multivorans]|uniref:Capsular polysaccharide biosynthesis protein n=1 Tax=Sulfuriferula multivorans TaxID=1559896 RepID=A0A401JBM6_9PROT|nr:undecaprenyl-phosphate glucose phosphotransferase [Sulfuriferula multivorans]GBL45088.1 capsular polysaccharide biosynthesis protein [Sulfuriferula multivorans]